MNENLYYPTFGNMKKVWEYLGYLKANQGGTQVYPGVGIPLSTGSAWATSITDNSANWNTAYTDRFKWDGGATGLVAATGRTSLGLVIGTNIPAINATTFVGTTSIALNRSSAAQVLTGITGLTPSANFVLTQNSVAALTSVESGAIVDTATLKAGKVGILNNNPTSTLDVAGSGRFTGLLTLANSLTSIGSGNPILISNFPTSSIVYGKFNNSTGNIIWGVEDTDGGNIAVGSAASAALLGTATNKSLQFFTSTTVRYSIDSSGNHDFKSGTATFNGTINSTNQTVTSGTPVTGTNSISHLLVNTGGTVFMGCERNTGGDIFSGSSGYAAVFGSAGGRAVELGAGGVIRYSISTGGDHNFKTGAITIGSTFTSTNITTPLIFSNTTATTNAKYLNITNTGADSLWAIESSTGASIVAGTDAYSTVFGSAANKSLHLITNGVVRQTIDNIGAITFGNTISTIDPTSGAGPAWKLGAIKTVVAATLTLNYVEISVGGVIYKVPTIS